MRSIIVTLLACLLPVGLATGQEKDQVLSSVEKQFGLPAMKVAKPKAPPTIDGKLDDEAWKAATPVTLGFLVGGWDTPTQKTQARVLADEKTLYVAVQCFEKEMDRVISAGDKRDSELWNGDTVEVFMDPGHSHKGKQAFHIITNPKGALFDAKGGDTKAWNADIEVKAGTFDGGWCVELAVHMKDLGIEGGIPKVWGLNINRQRPELGEKREGTGLLSHPIDVAEPAKYREGEDTSWAPTGCESSHIIQTWGHALLEAGTVDVAPPAKVFELIYKSDFDAGQIGPFSGAELKDEGFPAPGKCIAPTKDSKGAIHFGKELTDIDDATLLMVFRMPADGRLYFFTRDKDSEQCDADRNEVFISPAAAAARKFLGRTLYDTHSDKMAWKTNGRLEGAPGPWKMMTGHFGESSIGSIISPGKDWCVLRTRLGQLRRQRSQGMMPLGSSYPRGLTVATGDAYQIADFVVFRGRDVKAPETPAGVTVKKEGEDVLVSWKKSKDNTLTAYYRVLAGKEVLAETFNLSAMLKAAQLAGAKAAGELTVQAADFYNNLSAPSTAVKLP